MEVTVKSAYYVALSLAETEGCGECSNGDQRTPLWRKIWHLKIPAKIRISAWRACVNGLSTRLNLCRRGVNINPLCPMCEQEPESISHTLLHCNFAKQVWDKWEGCPINMKVRQGDFTDFALQTLNTGATQDLEILLVTSWSIWYNRNQKVFEDGTFHLTKSGFLLLQPDLIIERWLLCVIKNRPLMQGNGKLHHLVCAK